MLTFIAALTSARLLAYLHSLKLHFYLKDMIAGQTISKLVSFKKVDIKLALVSLVPCVFFPIFPQKSSICSKQTNISVQTAKCHLLKHLQFCVM